MKLIEHLRQPYTDCVWTAGWVEDHPHDTMYLHLERDSGKDTMTLTLRPDEMAAIAWLATGMLWSHEIQQVLEKKE